MSSRQKYSGLGILNDASSFAATVVRLGRGLARNGDADPEHPARPLELWDYEGCPFCRKVRETLCELDLDVLVHPVAHGSQRRESLKQLGGKVQVPYLVDPNMRTAMYESNAIVVYLHAQYGGGKPPWGLETFPLVNTIDSFIASAVRLGRGVRVEPRLRNHLLPASPLELFNMEGSPYCRKVREVLSELDLEHIVRNVPKGSPKRDRLRTETGKVQVPYLVDPNNGTAMFESDAIVTYLYELYGASAEGRAA